MKVFWNDGGNGVSADDPQPVTAAEATRLWSDEVRGVQGNFLGLIDDADRTVQFFYDDGIPDEVEDARALRIVLMDFPVPGRRGSYGRQVTIGEVPALIAQAFDVGADHDRFDEVAFSAW